MTPLSKLVPKETTAKVTLEGGESVELVLRPFNMRDYSFFQEHHNDAESRQALAETRADAICRLVWNQLDVTSKLFFSAVTFQDVDDDGNKITIELKGYEKLLNAIATEEDLWRLLDAYIQCKGLNGFVQEKSGVGLKKKLSLFQRLKLIGLKRSISSLLNTHTPPNSSSI